jgi:hypothetical protein
MNYGTSKRHARLSVGRTCKFVLGLASTGILGCEPCGAGHVPIFSFMMQHTSHSKVIT